MLAWLGNAPDRAPRLNLPRAPEQRLQPGFYSRYRMAGGRTWHGICQVVVVAIRTMWRGAHSGLPPSRYWRRSIPHQVQTSVSKSKLWPPAHRSSAYHRPRRKDRITLAAQESSPIRRIEGDFATQWRRNLDVRSQSSVSISNAIITLRHRQRSGPRRFPQWHLAKEALASPRYFILLAPPCLLRSCDC
jgi:hypothetical protein